MCAFPLVRPSLYAYAVPRHEPPTPDPKEGFGVGKDFNRDSPSDGGRRRAPPQGSAAPGGKLSSQTGQVLIHIDLHGMPPRRDVAGKHFFSLRCDVLEHRFPSRERILAG